MKNLFSLIFLLCITDCIAQSMDQVVFDYDNAGNQIKRYLIDIGDRQNPKPVKEVEDIVESDLIKADIYDDIQYYPNPVKEQLYIKWNFVDGDSVKSISLYSLSGQLIKTVNNLEKESAYTVPFLELPQGMYNLVMNCTNGTLKSLKIIKH